MEGTTARVDRGEATRMALVSAARELFTDRGYGSVGTEEIVRRAEVTRGALYHHFVDKKDLFRAVHQQIQEELVKAVAEDMAVHDDPLEALVDGARTYLDICTDPSITRVALIDAPSVLGWEEWREIDMRNCMGLVSMALQAGMDAGRLRTQPVQPLAHIMFGAIAEAGMVIANAVNADAARAEVGPALLGLLGGLLAEGVPTPPRQRG